MNVVFWNAKPFRYKTIAGLAVAIANSLLPAQSTRPVAEPFSLGENGSLAPIAPAFSPDGKLVVFFVSDGTQDTLYTARRVGTSWSKPTVAPFSGQYRDLEPAFDPNGKYLVFASNRPTVEGGTKLKGKYAGQAWPDGGGNLWRVDLHGNTWGSPRRLPYLINTSASTFSPAVTADGSIFFMRPVPEGGQFHIFRSQYEDGQYLPAVEMPFSLPGTGDWDPSVAPDEKYMIFSSERAPSVKGKASIFITFKTSNGWGALKNLSEKFSPDA